MTAHPATKNDSRSPDCASCCGRGCRCFYIDRVDGREVEIPTSLSLRRLPSGSLVWLCTHCEIELGLKDVTPALSLGELFCAVYGNRGADA